MWIADLGIDRGRGRRTSAGCRRRSRSRRRPRPARTARPARPPRPGTSAGATRSPGPRRRSHRDEPDVVRGPVADVLAVEELDRRRCARRRRAAARQPAGETDVGDVDGLRDAAAARSARTTSTPSASSTPSSHCTFLPGPDRARDGLQRRDRHRPQQLDREPRDERRGSGIVAARARARAARSARHRAARSETTARAPSGVGDEPFTVARRTALPYSAIGSVGTPHRTPRRACARDARSGGHSLTRGECCLRSLVVPEDAVLAGKVALITGAASGQGRAAALLFAAHGAAIAIADIDERRRGRDVTRSSNTKAARAIAVHVDVSRRVDCDAMVAATIAEFGRLDVLYNNAAVQMSGRLVDCTEDEWDLTIATNLNAIFWACRAALPAPPAARRRVDHQHRVDARADRFRGLRRVRRRQGRARRAHPADRGRVRADGARQRDRARFDRHAALPQGDRTARRPGALPRDARRPASRCNRSAPPTTSPRSRCSSRATRRRTRRARSSRATAASPRCGDVMATLASRVDRRDRWRVRAGRGDRQPVRADGDRVVVADVDEPRAQQVADNLIAAGRTVEAMTVDVTSEGEVAAMIDATRERLGRLDALVCSAAVETRSSVIDCGDDQWQRVIDVNLKGPFLCMKHGIPRSPTAVAARSCSSVRCSGRWLRPATPRTARRRARS